QQDTGGSHRPVAYADTVKDRAGNPIAGVTITWGAAGGGSITPSSITGANGAASATRTLGTVAGVQTATASVTGLTGSPSNFSAPATPANPKTLAKGTGTDAE